MSDAQPNDRVSLRRSEVLVLQHRVPEGFSATRAEHQWHDYPTPHQSTSGLTFGEVLELAEQMRAIGTRTDYVYRVVHVTTETTGRLVP